MSTVTQQIRELQEMTVTDLAVNYEALFGQPPRVRNAAYLRRRLAWKIQELEFGGLSAKAKSRLDELISKIDLPLGDSAPRRAQRVARNGPKAPLVGTTLIRSWHGQELRVEVRDEGFEWDGTIYRSLTAVARAITGSAWNGRLFFGLTKRRSTR